VTGPAPDPADGGVRPAGRTTGDPAERLLRALRIDAPLPPRGPARWATLLGLGLGGLVAVLVVVFFGVVAWGAWRS
jgi:hypothetical protein